VPYVANESRGMTASVVISSVLQAVMHLVGKHQQPLHWK